MKELVVFIVVFWSVFAFGQEVKLGLPVGHTNKISSAKYSPDGSLIVTSSYDNTVNVWNVKGGYLIHSLVGHTQIVNSAMFSPDGKMIISTSSDSTAKIWDVESGVLLQNLLHENEVISAEFNNSSTKIVTTTTRSRIVVWNTNGVNLMRSEQGNVRKWPSRFYMSSATFSHEDDYILADYGLNQAILYKLNKDNDFEIVYSRKLERSFYGVFIKDKNQILFLKRIFLTNGIFGIREANAIVYDINKKKDIKLYKNADWFFTNGELLYGYDVYLIDEYREQVDKSKEFDIEDFRPYTFDHIVWQLKNDSIITRSRTLVEGEILAFLSSNSTSIILSKTDSTLILTDIINNSKISEIKHVGYFQSSELSPNGKTILILNFNSDNAHIYEVSTERLLTNLEGHTNSIIDTRIDLKKETISTTPFILGLDKLVNERNFGIETNSYHALKKYLCKTIDWNMSNGKMDQQYALDSGEYLSSVFSNSGKLLAIIPIKGNTLIWNREKDELIMELEVSWSAQFTNKEDKILLQPQLNTDVHSTLIDLITGKELAKFKDKAILSPNDSLIICWTCNIILDTELSHAAYL